MNKATLTVSVAIPAYNEEANIKTLLESIVKQEEVGFFIKEIIVLSDGSTDKTVEKAREVTDRRIRIFDYKKRVGKSYYLNTFPGLVSSDVLVLFDADVQLEGQDVIAKLIEPIIKGKNVGLVSADFQPAEVRTFLQKSIYSTVRVFEVLRHEWKNGHNAFGCTGRIQALSKAFYSVLSVPETMVLNDIYTYFYCLKNGFEFRHVASIKVYYQLPTTLPDYISQFKRFSVGSLRIHKIFGSLYEREYAIPKKWFYSLILREMLRHPVHCLFIKTVHMYGNWLAKKELKTMNGKWEMAKSTKKLQFK